MPASPALLADARFTHTGLLVARVLEGAWRREPPTLNVSPHELGVTASLLVGCGAGAVAWNRVFSQLEPRPGNASLENHRDHGVFASQISEKGAIVGTKTRRGRPSEYDPSVAAKLCELIGGGKPLHVACQTKGMPSPTTVYRWMNDHPEFAMLHHVAQHARFDQEAEKLKDLADQVGDDAPSIARVRLQIETRKWLMSKALPRKYGDVQPMPAPPPPEPMLAIADAKLINAKAEYDPLGEAFENFHRALLERKKS